MKQFWKALGDAVKATDAVGTNTGVQTVAHRGLLNYGKDNGIYFECNDEILNGADTSKIFDTEILLHTVTDGEISCSDVVSELRDVWNEGNGLSIENSDISCNGNFLKSLSEPLYDEDLKKWVAVVTIRVIWSKKS